MYRLRGIKPQSRCFVQLVDDSGETTAVIPITASDITSKRDNRTRSYSFLIKVENPVIENPEDMITDLEEDEDEETYEPIEIPGGDDE